jgi:hypothetical protein
MSDLALIIPGQSLAPPFSLTPEAVQLKDGALESSVLIARVANRTECDIAVNAQKELVRVEKLFEEARVAATKPLLEAQRALKAVVDKHKQEIAEEKLRISKLIGDFEALELAKARAAEVARRKELDEIERQKEEALAKASSHEELDRIHEEANRRAAEVPTVEVKKTPGQVVTEDWEFEVTDIHTLYRAHPLCVQLTERRQEIRQLLNAGIIPAGVRAKKIVKSGVRLGRESNVVTV